MPCPGLASSEYAWSSAIASGKEVRLADGQALRTTVVGGGVDAQGTLVGQQLSAILYCYCVFGGLIY